MKFSLAISCAGKTGQQLVPSDGMYRLELHKAPFLQRSVGDLGSATRVAVAFADRSTRHASLSLRALTKSPSCSRRFCLGTKELKQKETERNRLNTERNRNLSIHYSIPSINRTASKSHLDTLEKDQRQRESIAKLHANEMNQKNEPCQGQTCGPQLIKFSHLRGVLGQPG